MKPFRFLRKPFNTEDYDIPNFRFLGVSPEFLDDLTNRYCRKMIFVYGLDGTIVPAQIIHEDHEAYHEADVYVVIDNQVFLTPRTPIDFINVTFNILSNEDI